MALGQGGKYVCELIWKVASGQSGLYSFQALATQPPCSLPLGLPPASGFPTPNLVSQGCLRKEGRNPQARCAEIDLLKEVNSDLGDG